MVAPADQLYATFANKTENVVLQWTGGGALESAPHVTGPWLEVTGATSPHLAPLDQPATFYRIRR